MKKKSLLYVLFTSSLTLSIALATEQSVTMNLVNEKGSITPVGVITISETPYGLLFSPKLHNLTAGLHGFHVHENPSCDPKEINNKIVPAGAAGGHLDPDNTKKHGAPWGDGHLGDLPALTVTADGNSINPVLAPRLKMADLKNRSLMIHIGGDNHSDQPAPLGGGGARIACGVI